MYSGSALPFLGMNLKKAGAKALLIASYLLLCRQRASSE
jgi:hypothetical protein